jgi:tryptophan synthase alpha chain
LESTTKLLSKPQFAKGAIIGSAFIQDLTKNGTGKIDAFVDAIR